MLKDQLVIVLGSNPATRLGLIRSVGEVGCRVSVVHIGGVLREKPYDVYSKYVQGFFLTPKSNKDSLRDLLMKHFGGQDEKPILMSVDDDSACMIDQLHDELKDDFLFAHIDHTQGRISAIMNKMIQKKMAEEAGFVVAKGWKLDSNDGHYTIPQDIVYPCYVKGCISYHTEKRLQKRCDNEEALRKHLKIIEKKSSYPLIVEEMVHIDEECGVIAYCNNGEVVAPSLVRFICMGKGGHSGVSRMGVVEPLQTDSPLWRNVQSLLTGLNYTGICNIDLFRRGEEYVFVEMNMRFAAYGYAVTRSGVNLPAMLVKTLRGEDVSSVSANMSRKVSYCNEKVAADNYIEREISYSEMIDSIRRADIGLIKWTDDNRPYSRFIKSAVRFFIRKRLAMLIKR